jgi:membrane protein implicated in regulation of membrane protease activity
MPEWGWWVLGAIVLLGIEALTLDLIFASLALGAVVGAIVAAFGGGVVAQVLAAVIVALLTLFLLRPVGVRILRTEGHQTNVDALIGAHALVMERVDARTGRVKVGGEIWSARTRRPGTEFGAGTDLVVFAIDGATAVVDHQPDVSGGHPSDSGTTGE